MHTFIILCTTIHYIGIGSNSILGGPNVIYTGIVAICAVCMNVNKVSRVKYWGGLALPDFPPPLPPGSYTYALDLTGAVHQE